MLVEAPNMSRDPPVLSSSRQRREDIPLLSRESLSFQVPQFRPQVTHSLPLLQPSQPLSQITQPRRETTLSLPQVDHSSTEALLSLFQASQPQSESRIPLSQVIPPRIVTSLPLQSSQPLPQVAQPMSEDLLSSQPVTQTRLSFPQNDRPRTGHSLSFSEFVSLAEASQMSDLMAQAKTKYANTIQNLHSQDESIKDDYVSKVITSKNQKVFIIKQKLLKFLRVL